MVPVTSMVTLPQQATIAECEQLILVSGHTRFPVAGQNSQEFIGMVHAKELLSFGPEEQGLPLPPAALRALVTADQSLTLEEVLRTMRQNKTHLVVLENSAGQPQGLITMEDIVQELMGE
jgi:CBS domain containing-hemolysin-like protein